MSTQNALEKHEERRQVVASMDTVEGFEALQRMAKMFSQSDIVPERFRNIANAVICLDMAHRMGANPLMVAQNLYVVHGQPGWSAKFLIATFNQSRRFSPIRYEFVGTRGKEEGQRQRIWRQATKSRAHLSQWQWRRQRDGQRKTVQSGRRFPS